MITLVYDTEVHPGFPLSRNELLGLIEVCLDAMGMDEASFSLRLVDDAEISRLNAAFLGCTGPTNILSFPAEPEEGSDEQSLGELALSVPTLVREADLYGQNPLEHTARLLSHGILHITGYDHSPEMDMMTDAAVQAALDEFSNTPGS